METNIYEQIDISPVAAATVCRLAAPVIWIPFLAQVRSATPSLAGTAEAGSTVTVREGDTVICTTTAWFFGTWSCVPSTALADGSHTVTATATDAAGNVSPASAARTLTVRSVGRGVTGLWGPARVKRHLTTRRLAW